MDTIRMQAGTDDIFEGIWIHDRLHDKIDLIFVSV